MLVYYGDHISPHMTTTPEGFLICRDVPIARTGEMDYRAADLLLEGDPDRLVKVYRHPEDVFDPAAMASFEGKEVTNGHPAEDVGPENHAAYSKGHIQNVRRQGDRLIADLHLKDAALISDVRSGVMREVSCGYHKNRVTVRLTNAINRGLEKPEHPDEVVTLIMQGISARYACFPAQMTATDILRLIREKDYDQAIRYITITAENAVTVTFK